MTREDAYFERILLLSGFWDEYDEWLDYYLETEDPLSDIVLELIDCRTDIKEVEYRLYRYCLEKEFDESSVAVRLRLFLKEKYNKGRMSKDEALAAMFRFSSHLDPLNYDSCRMMIMSDYYDLAKTGIIDSDRFDKMFFAYLMDGRDFTTDAFWKSKEN